MRITLDTTKVEDYRTFLQVKALPVYSIHGREASFPDEYASRLGLNVAKAKSANYKPSTFLFDYQRDIASLAPRYAFSGFEQAVVRGNVFATKYVGTLTRVVG